jgi:hypothetical protein
MERKKILKKMAIIAIILIILSSLILIWESVFQQDRKNERVQWKNVQIAQLSQHFQKFLDGVAGKINEISVSPDIIAKIKSEILKQKPNTKLYLWMSSTGDGEFIFGVPSPVFTRLNKIYDRYRNAFEKYGYYVNRDDFLEKVVLHQDEIELFESEPESEKINFREWSLPRSPFIETHDSRYTRLNLSSPVFDQDNQILGECYLIVEDFKPQMTDNIFDSSFFRGFFEFSHILFGFSMFLLWLIIPSWVYIDSRQRDMKNAFKWALVTVLSFGFAALIYSIVRPTGTKSFYCPECQKELNGTKAFCPYCGFDLSSTFCPNCQYPVKLEWQFCPSCRFELKQKPEKENSKTNKS